MVAVDGASALSTLGVLEVFEPAPAGTTPARARQDAGAPRSDRPAVSRSNTEGTRSGSASLKS